MGWLLNKPAVEASPSGTFWRKAFCPLFKRLGRRERMERALGSAAGGVLPTPASLGAPRSRSPHRPHAPLKIELYTLTHSQPREARFEDRVRCAMRLGRWTRQSVKVCAKYPKPCCYDFTGCR